MKEYFPEPDAAKEWARNPFSAISQVEAFSLPGRDCVMASDETQKRNFSEKSLLHFVRISRATNHLLPVPTIYNCQLGFSNFIEITPEKKNPPDVERRLRLKKSVIQPDTDILVQGLKQCRLSHWCETIIIIIIIVRLTLLIISYIVLNDIVNKII
jgi:hypothetical protein